LLCIGAHRPEARDVVVVRAPNEFLHELGEELIVFRSHAIPGSHDAVGGVSERFTIGIGVV
jgi:hypothetical protein